MTSVTSSRRFLGTVGTKVSCQNMVTKPRGVGTTATAPQVPIITLFAERVKAGKPLTAMDHPAHPARYGKDAA
jgi:hypothetical protein